jgi:GH25 family lysozyme M1 (1,4-beta-N-acetylmuramidase)
MTRTFGIDISKYNYSADGSKKPDFDKMKATCSFVAVRAGISWGYADAWFSYSWEHLKGIPRMAYHVPYFGENPTSQMDNFFKIVGNADWNTDRLVLDAELVHTNTKYQITLCTNQMMAICKARTGRLPIIYSRATWLNPYMGCTDLPEKTEYWLAGYRTPRVYPLFTDELPSPPILPNGVTNWLIHQTAEKQSGSAVGVVSYYVDTNRWNGDNDVMKAYFSMTTPPVIPLTLEEKVADHERRISALERI